MQNPTITPKLMTIVALIAAGIASRIIPHAPNFTAVIAVSLFAGAKLQDKKLAYIIPLCIMLITDLIIGFHNTLIPVYICMAISVALGQNISQKQEPIRVMGTALLASVIFFLFTNFAVWLNSGIYTLDAAGLSACYVAAIPFFKYSLTADLLYTAILFGGFALLQKRIPSLAA